VRTRVENAREASVRSITSLALVLVAALGLVGWLALRGRREEASAARAPSRVAPEASRESGELESAVVPSETAAARETVAPVRPTAVDPVPHARPVRPRQPNEGLLHVRVVARETHEPLAGVRTSLVGDGDDISPQFTKRSRGRANESLVTDADGLVQYLVPEQSPCHLSVNSRARRASDAEIDVPPLRADEERHLEVELDTLVAERRYGRVIDGDSGAPLEGAEIEGLADRSLRLESDADGRFEFASADWRNDFVHAQLAGYTPAEMDLARCDDVARPGVIALLRVASLAARVSDEHGEPLEGVTVRVDDSDLSPRMLVRTSSEPSHALTDASGTCVLEGLPARTELTLRWLGRSARGRDSRFFRHEALWLEPGERREWSGVVRDGVRVSGVVLGGAGAPERGVRVQLAAEKSPDGAVFGPGARFRARADEHGAFAFDGVQPGVWCVSATAESGGSQAPFVASTLVVDVQDEPVGDLRLIVSRDLFIRGRVLRPDRQALEPRELATLVSGRSGSFSASVHVDREGAFRLGPLVPGDYQVVAAGAAELAESEPALVRAGANDAELVLRAGSSLSGTVLDARGRPAPLIEVHLLGADDTGGVSFSSSAGAFEFERVPGGTFGLRALSNAGEVAWLDDVRVEPGASTTGVQLRLQPGAHIAMRFVGAPLGRLECRARVAEHEVARTSFERSRFVRLDVPAERVELRFEQLQDGAGLAPAPVTLELVPGEERRLRFDLGSAPR